MPKATHPEAPLHPAYQAWTDGSLAPVPAIRSMYSDLAAVTAQINAAEAIRAGLRRDLGDVVCKTQPRGTITLEDATLRWVEPSVVTSLSSERVREAQQILSDALTELEATGDLAAVLDGARTALSTLQAAWRSSNRVGFLQAQPVRSQANRDTATITIDRPEP
ncbi:MAG: hypothetical protein AB4911_10095 [Oscillochloridaceae bacterium umkhey_bin13]